MPKISQCVPFGHYTALINQKNGPKDNANLSSRRCLNGSPPVAPLQAHPSPNFLGGSSWRVAEPPRTPLPKEGLLKGTAGPGFGHRPGQLLSSFRSPSDAANGCWAKRSPRSPTDSRKSQKNEVKNEVIQPLLIPPCLFSPSFGSVCQPTV